MEQDSVEIIVDPLNLSESNSFETEFSDENGLITPDDKLQEEYFEYVTDDSSTVFGNDLLESNLDDVKEEDLDKKVESDNDKLSCEICGKKLKNAISYKKHISLHQNDALKCEVCHKFYPSKIALQYHLTIHKRKLTCEFCDFVTPHYSALKSHRRKHTGERPFKCSFCGKGFIQKVHMDSHMAANHSDSKNQFLCEVCGRTFFTSTKYWNHYNIVHSNVEKTYKCDICEKWFHRKADLKSHSYIHTKDCQFACMICDARFKTADSQRRHQKKHYSAFYPCEFCGKMIQHGSMAGHIRYHTLQKKKSTDTCAT